MIEYIYEKAKLFNLSQFQVMLILMKLFLEFSDTHHRPFVTIRGQNKGKIVYKI